MLHLVNIDKVAKTLDVVDPKVYANDKFILTGLHSDIIYPTPNDQKFKLTQFDIQTEYINPFLVFLFQRHHKKIYEGLLGVPVLITKKSVETSAEGISGIQLMKQIYSDNSIEIHPTIRKLLQRSEWESIIASKIIVIPPAFRAPYERNLSTLDVLYMKLGAKRGRSQSEIQHLVQELFTTILTTIKGKSGYLRSLLLSRRVDFSGRFVITVDPTLDLDHVYLPYRALGILFAPSIIHLLWKRPKQIDQLFQSNLIPNNPQSIERLLQHFYNRELPEEIENVLCKIIDIAITDKVIVAKRDPVLHQGSVFAFYPLGSKASVANSHTMSISPLVTEPFNADFDGDTMAVYVPQTVEAIEEAKKLLPSAKRFSAGSGKVYFEIKQDYVIALYLLTKNTSKSQPDETLVYPYSGNWYDLYKKYVTVASNPITVKQSDKVFKSTYGRYIINAIANLPSYINEPFTKKVANQWMSLVAKVAIGIEFMEVINRLNFVATDINNRQPITVDLQSLTLPATVVNIETLSQISNPDEFNKELEKTMKRVKEYLSRYQTPIFDMIESGARGSWDDIQQLLVARGFVTDVYGNVVLKPIPHSFTHGLTPEDIYTSASGWRKGMIDRSINTAESGYLTRQLVYALMPIRIKEHDCHTTQGLKILVTEENKQTIVNRYLLNTSELITDPNPFVGKEIVIRSPMYCKTKDHGICSICYGKLSNQTEVGIIAAQTLGERSTQLIMKTFHTGGHAHTRSMNVSKTIPKELILENTTLKALVDIVLIIKDTDQIDFRDSSIIIHPQPVYIRTNTKETVWNLENDLLITKDSNPSTFQPNLVAWSFSAGEDIGTVILGSSGVQSAITIVKHQLGSMKEDYLPEEYLFTLYETYSKITTIPLIHFEILVSALARTQENINILWRYHTHSKPVILSLKQAIATSSKLNLFFENPSRALDLLVNSKDTSDSPLEQMLGV